MSAQSTQVGGDHYKKWNVEPHVLMAVLVGPAAHIVGYLLRTKGDDDLDKALHWCKLANETKTLELSIPWASLPGQLIKLRVESWLYFNGIEADTHLSHAIRHLANLNYEEAYNHIGAIKRGVKYV